MTRTAPPPPTRTHRRLPWRLWLLLLLLFCFSLAAAYVYWRYFRPVPPRLPVTLVRVSDGDTVVLCDQRGQQYSVRLYGVDTAELGTAQSFRAALFSAERLEQAARIELEPEGKVGGSGRFKPAHDKYGRVLGWVWYSDRQGDLRLLNEELLLARQAVLYHKKPQGKYGERLWRAARK